VQQRLTLGQAPVTLGPLLAGVNAVAVDAQQATLLQLAHDVAQGRLCRKHVADASAFGVAVYVVKMKASHCQRRYLAFAQHTAAAQLHHATMRVEQRIVIVAGQYQ